MGRDKALVEWDGVPMAQRMARALTEGGCRPVFAVGGDAAALQALGLVVVPDGWPGEGPLGGVITALEHAAGAAVVVVACDMPSLSPVSVGAVAAGLGEGAEVAVAVSDRLEPLCAAWAPATLPALRRAFDAGIRDLSGQIATLRRCEVPIPLVEARNVNAPRDLEQ